MTLKQIIKKTVNQLGFDIVKYKKYELSTKLWPILENIPQTTYEVDTEFHSYYEASQLKTQMSETDNALRRQRHYILNQIIKNVDFSKGDVCELGCWRGLSARQISEKIKNSGINTVFHIFDSFEGLSEIKAEDKPMYGELKGEITQKHFACSMDTVKNNLAEYGFIKYYKGWIPERFKEVENLKFSFVHIDVDLYQPILDSISFFYPRMVKNGIIVFDDYGCLQFPGAQKSVDEYLKSKNDEIFFIPLTSGQAFLIKLK